VEGNYQIKVVYNKDNDYLGSSQTVGSVSAAPTDNTTPGIPDYIIIVIIVLVICLVGIIGFVAYRKRSTPKS
jgi:beta-lactamase regulating signal transducer with metallopeptidase domain